MKPPRILIVDDENDIIESLRTGLARRGFDVDISNHPRAALDKITNNVYDLIFLDMKMPDMSGFEIYHEIKRKDPKAKVVFLTAFEINPEGVTKVSPDLTPNNFVQKPISLTRLTEFINEQLGSRM